MQYEVYDDNGCPLGVAPKCLPRAKPTSCRYMIYEDRGKRLYPLGLHPSLDNALRQLGRLEIDGVKAQIIRYNG